MSSQESDSETQFLVNAVNAMDREEEEEDRFLLPSPTTPLLLHLFHPRLMSLPLLLFPTLT